MGFTGEGSCGALVIAIRDAMKFFLTALVFLVSAPSFAAGGEGKPSEITCSYDHRAYDGDAATVKLAVSTDGNSAGKYDFNLTAIPGGRRQAETFVFNSTGLGCVFGEKFSGVFSCFRPADRYEETTSIFSTYEVVRETGDQLTFTLTPPKSSKSGNESRIVQFNLHECAIFKTVVKK